MPAVVWNMVLELRSLASEDLDAASPVATERVSAEFVQPQDVACQGDVNMGQDRKTEVFDPG